MGKKSKKLLVAPGLAPPAFTVHNGVLQQLGILELQLQERSFDVATDSTVSVQRYQCFNAAKNVEFNQYLVLAKNAFKLMLHLDLDQPAQKSYPAVQFTLPQKPQFGPVPPTQMVEFHGCSWSLGYRVVHPHYHARVSVSPLDRFSMSGDATVLLNQRNKSYGAMSMEYEPLRSGVKRFMVSVASPLEDFPILEDCPFLKGSDMIVRYDFRHGFGLHFSTPLPIASRSCKGVLVAESSRMIVGLQSYAHSVLDRVACYATFAKESSLTLVGAKRFNKMCEVSCVGKLQFNAMAGRNIPSVGLQVTM